MEMFLSLGLLVFLMTCPSGTRSQTDYGEINMYYTSRVTLHEAGDHGTVTYNGPINNDNKPTILRIQAKPSTYLTVTPSSNFTLDRCSSGFQISTCVPGCFYVYLFDAYYYNNTLTYVWNSEWKSFNTSSSVLYVSVCHLTGTKHIDFKLRFKSIERRFMFGGDSVHAKSGQVASPYFPNSYTQNGEQTTYVFHSRFVEDKVVLEFDDFDIAPGGYLYFHPTTDYQQPIKITDDSQRYVVVSTGNDLQFIFDHGWPGEAYRSHMGFKLTYKFISAHETYIRPSTYCGRYFLTLDGGEIDFTPPHFDKPYDCVWVVKTQPGYAGTYMKLNRFSSDYVGAGNPGDVSVEIRDGLTSEGTVVGTLFPTIGGVFRDYQHKDGFYIRLRGKFSFSVTFKIGFSSYNNFYSSGCDESDHFRCSTGMCIPKHLACDRTKHCRDDSDETYGCDTRLSSREDQQTMTISVVIPVVVSIFLLIVLCVMFIMIRRCRRQRELTNMVRTESDDPVVCTTDRHRRRRRQHDFYQRPPDAPPTYDEALITGIPVPDDDYEGPPKPPSYLESLTTPMIQENDFPSPPYSSRENVNETFLDDDNQVTQRSMLGQAESQSSSEPGSSTNRPNPNENKDQKDRVNMLSQGRLPDLSDLKAAVGTQSMVDISNIGQNKSLAKARSEQILAPQDLGVINLAFTDDHDRRSRLYRGHAVSNLDLPTNRHVTNSEEVSSNPDLPPSSLTDSEDRHSNTNGYKNGYPPNKSRNQDRDKQISERENNAPKHGKQEQKQSSYHQSAWDRLKPGNPKNDLKYGRSAHDYLGDGQLQKRDHQPNRNLNDVRYDPNRKQNMADERGNRTYRYVDDNAYPRKPNSRFDKHDRDDNLHEENRKGHNFEQDEKHPSSNYRKRSGKAVPNNIGNNRPKNSFNDRTLQGKGLSKYQHSGSNPGLNLCAGHTSDLHRSTMSLNENALSFNRRNLDSGANSELDDSFTSAGGDGFLPIVSLNDICEDIYV